ncbi:MFS transporter [Streptomyces sp. NPDC055082]|uniref:MFS transporter n=1 Tax=Streptomyces sp. NPDC055082 TaxID=3365718 RepID=UPI0037D7BC4F
MRSGPPNSRCLAGGTAIVPVLLFAAGCGALQRENERQVVAQTARWVERYVPFAPVLSHPRLRRVWPGFIVSFLGDGMSAVAVSWLALQLAPQQGYGLWVALAVGAYTLPGAAGVVLLGPLMRGRGGAQLLAWNAWLRTVGLGLIPVAAFFDVLSIGVYVGLLAASSLLRSWGSAGYYTLVAEMLPKSRHLSANALISTLSQTGILIGPVIAGLLIAWVGALWALAVDALTFAILAVTCRFALPTMPRTERAKQEKDRTAGFRFIARQPALLGVMALTFGFYLLYGPIEVGLPVHVADDLKAPASVLAWHFAAFGAGAVGGGLLAAHLGRLPHWLVLNGSVIGAGLALLPLGLGAPIAVTVPCFGAVGVLYAPFGATSTALIQRTVGADDLAQVLAARSALLVTSGPAGIGIGGLIVAGWGAGRTLLSATLATLGLGVVSAVLCGLRRVRPRPLRPTEVSGVVR